MCLLCVYDIRLYVSLCILHINSVEQKIKMSDFKSQVVYLDRYGRNIICYLLVKRCCKMLEEEIIIHKLINNNEQ
jgi:hypothetical protein